MTIVSFLFLIIMSEFWKDVGWSPERVFYLLEHRFQKNSFRTSFDFKSFPPDQPAKNTKISRSGLELYSTGIKLVENEEENLSSEDESEEISSSKSTISLGEDEHLDKLAQWEPEKSPLLNIESEEEEEMNEEIAHVNPVDLPTGKFRTETNVLIIHSRRLETSSNDIEDLFVTFVHHPVKTEPVYNLPQLDGQTDSSFSSNHK